MQITEGFFIKIPSKQPNIVTTGGKQPLHSAGRYTRLCPEPEKQAGMTFQTKEEEKKRSRGCAGVSLLGVEH